MSDSDWYDSIHDGSLELHTDFQDYLEYLDYENVLEVGCRTGVFLRHYKLFDDSIYTGIDLSESAIHECKTHCNANFICGDFEKLTIPWKFDLVFSHTVIDHVNNVDDFIRRVVDTCEKYAYIMTANGYHDTIPCHKTEWDSTYKCYINYHSMSQIRDVLFDMGLNERQFLIRPYFGYGVIEIDKTVS